MKKEINTEKVENAAMEIYDIMSTVRAWQNQIAINNEEHKFAKETCAYTGQNITKFKAKLKLENRKINRDMKRQVAKVKNNIVVLVDNVRWP